MAIYDYSSGGFPASPATDDTLAMKGTTYKYNGSAWEVQTGGTTSYVYTATSGQTAFTGSDSNSKTLAYTAASIHVFLNGVLLDAADYTATDGTTVTLGTGASTGDTLQVVAYGVLVSAGGGGGAWEVISSVAAAGATSVTISVSGYSTYKLVIDGLKTGGSARDIGVQFNIGSGIDTSSNYCWRRWWQNYYNSGISTDNNTGYSQGRFGTMVSNYFGSHFEMNFHSNSTLIQTSGITHRGSNSDDVSIFNQMSSIWLKSSINGNITQLKFEDDSSGALQGTFTLYGIKTS